MLLAGTRGTVFHTLLTLPRRWRSFTVRAASAAAAWGGQPPAASESGGASEAPPAVASASAPAEKGSEGKADVEPGEKDALVAAKPGRLPDLSAFIDK